MKDLTILLLALLVLPGCFCIFEDEIGLADWYESSKIQHSNFNDMGCSIIFATLILHHFLYQSDYPAINILHLINLFILTLHSTRHSLSTHQLKILHIII